MLAPTHRNYSRNTTLHYSYINVSKSYPTCKEYFTSDVKYFSQIPARKPTYTRSPIKNSNHF